MTDRSSSRTTINDLLLELVNSGERIIYAREAVIVYPVSNQAQILERGIRSEIKANNFVCAVSLLRSLMEAAMVLVYESTADKRNKEENYNQIVQNKRLRRWSKSKRDWENVRDEHLIQQFETSTKIPIRQSYNNACDMLHFSTKHFQMLGEQKASDTDTARVIFTFSESGPEVPKSEYDAIVKLTNDLMGIVQDYLAAWIQQKRRNHSEPSSVLAEKVLNGRQVINRG